ncbi:XF1762 family protein [Microtetraspora malaysiensis]|uniref:XF1762 family protein n=1 Tax=Microtetraspora malaysiensis TaxID=161358 RepID=A0ABW6SY16_9ACTN
MENWNEIQENAYGGWLNNPERGENPRLVISPVTIPTARAFVAWTHRYLAPPVDAEFITSVQTGSGTLVGVVFVDRPTEWVFDDGGTAEVICLATDGTPNACSALLGAAWRAARDMGYRRLTAYTRIDGPGTSLRAAGYRRVADRAPRVGWDTPSHPRASRGADDLARVLWEMTVRGGRP